MKIGTGWGLNALRDHNRTNGRNAGFGQGNAQTRPNQCPALCLLIRLAAHFWIGEGTESIIDLKLSAGRRGHTRSC